jgi:hypothetical protein
VKGIRSRRKCSLIRLPKKFSKREQRKLARLMHTGGSITMTLEQVQEYQRQAARGQQAQVVRPVMLEYLADIRADVVRELERETIGTDRLSTLQNRLYVIRALADKIDSHIKSGKIAERELREADESNGDV